MPPQTPNSSQRRNLLLGALDASGYTELLDGAEKEELKLRHVLYEANAPITHVYFLDQGVGSLIAPVGDGASVEVGTIGNEGFIGLPLLFEVDREPVTAIIQIAGVGFRIRASAFQNAIAKNEALRGLLLRYAQAYLNQVAQSSACNRAHSIEERCARWLLMTHDRVSSDEFVLTHEFLSLMLGVRRAGVTVAAGMLQKAGFIEYRHGRITIIDRKGLEGASCGCYRLIRDNFDRILGPIRQGARSDGGVTEA